MWLKLTSAQRNYSQLIICASIAVCCLSAMIILGAAGVVAAIIFAPLMLTLVFDHSQMNNREVSLRPQDARSFLGERLERFLGQSGHPTVSLMVELDGFNHLEELHDRAELEHAISFTQSVIETHLTDADVTVHLEGASFGSAIAPTAPFELEAMLITCNRIQHSLNTAQLFGEIPIQLTASIGFAASTKLAKPTGEGLIQASVTALAEARRKGPGAVRGFSRAMSRKRATKQQFSREAARAFERGDIRSFFQPQFCLETGELSGFEALTRWHHPERGIIAPMDFLPTLEHAGLMGALGDTMVKEALRALNYWDAAGLDVPSIGVNFSTEELRDPLIVDRIAMLLDASDLGAERLTIEVLEDVIANDAEDDIISNLAALSDLGCGIDLDDFGTGYASITNIRRFSVGRIKIDRSFVDGLDTDAEQRKMVSAILTMATRLGVKTLAEGVETKSEHQALRDLGCDHAQGFQFARPMPLEETVPWAVSHFGAQNKPVEISKRAG